MYKFDWSSGVHRPCAWRSMRVCVRRDSGASLCGVNVLALASWTVGSLREQLARTVNVEKEPKSTFAAPVATSLWRVGPSGTQSAVMPDHTVEYRAVRS